jgi:predicted ATPase/DNA-binding winged helix-turn-helix (wHTH) protein
MITAGATAQQHLLGARDPHSPQTEGPADSLQRSQEVSTMADPGAAPVERAIAFGPFHLLPAQRLLLQAGQPVRIGGRALEILLALVERPGELVSKDQLIARVWPNTFVEESNLKVQVAGLRRVLGDRRGNNRYLATTSGRGYSFVAPVTLTEVLSTPAFRAERAHNLPAPMARTIDRADTVQALTAQLPHRRLITIVGPGGVGKTTVALAVARSLIGAYEQSVRFVDLASLLDPRLVANALAAALGLEIRSEDPIPELLAALRGKPMLLVLDNCEHVVEAAAALALELLNGAPGLQILATSREPLRVEGEHTHRLSSLESPPASARLTAAQSVSFPAVQLFVERAAAASSAFTFGDEQAPLIAEICRRLDGIPLAIELAAARVDAFGVHGLAGHLDDCLQLLTGGSRAAPPRHQTFRATLDWGYDLLAAPERVVLRRLAAFDGGFTLEAASAVAASAEITAPEVVECVASLVTKSLVAADVEGPVPRYRLIETTRAYALEKLSDSGELEQVKRRHTEYFQNLLQRTELCWDTPIAERLAGIDAARAVRASWPAGDALFRAALPVDSVPA